MPEPESNATIFDEDEFTGQGGCLFIDWMQLVQRELVAHGYQLSFDLAEIWERYYSEDRTPHAAIHELAQAGTIVKALAE